jgi:hypothetical protein
MPASGSSNSRISWKAIIDFLSGQNFLDDKLTERPIVDSFSHTTSISGFPGGSTSPISTAGTPALFRASRNAAESERVTESRFMSAWRSLFYFGGQIGGQKLQQSRAGDGAMARTGCFPA